MGGVRDSILYTEQKVKEPSKIRMNRSECSEPDNHGVLLKHGDQGGIYIHPFNSFHIAGNRIFWGFSMTYPFHESFPISSEPFSAVTLVQKYFV